MAEVRGSSPLGSTSKICLFAGKTQMAKEYIELLQELCAATVQQPSQQKESVELRQSVSTQVGLLSNCHL